MGGGDAIVAEARGAMNGGGSGLHVLVVVFVGGNGG